MKETLEEFIDKVDTPADFDQFTFDEGIRVGAKWMQERMYSEEEVMSILINSLHSVELKDNKDYSKIYNGMKDWFEQFKKSNYGF